MQTTKLKKLYSSAEIQAICDISRQRLSVLRASCLKANVDYIVMGIRQIIYNASAITKIKKRQETNKKFRNK